MEDFEFEEKLNINPEDVYVNKDLQKEYTQLSINGETVAVIIPFKKDNVSVENLVVEDNGTVNISETIRNQEDSNKEIGDARRRLNERHLVDVPESQNVYTDSAFEFTTIKKVSGVDLSYINRTFPEYSQSKLFKDLMSIEDELMSLKNDTDVKSFLLTPSKYQKNIIDSKTYEYLDKLSKLSEKVDELIGSVKYHLPDEYLDVYDTVFKYGEGLKERIEDYYNTISDKFQSVLDDKESSFEIMTINNL
jgi:hypothetical protein